MIALELLIFDLDGTLVDTLDDITASVNYTLNRLGRDPLPREQVRQFVGDGLERLLARSLGQAGVPAEALSLYREHHRAHLTVLSRLYPSVPEILQYFSSIPLVVISNKSSEFVRPLLRQTGIEHCLSAFFGADAGLPLKPAPDLVLHALSQFNAAREAAAIVGDGTTDIRAGKAAGIITCAAAWGFRSEAELSAADPDYLLRDPTELKNIFQPSPAPAREQRTKFFEADT